MPETVANTSSFDDEVSAIGSLFDLLAPPAWHRDAACREHPELDWMPERGAPTAPHKAVCAGCLVRSECQAWAFGQGYDLHGIWGGLSMHQRHQAQAAERNAQPDTRRARARELRAEGLTLAKIADALGVSAGAISKWTREAA